MAKQLKDLLGEFQFNNSDFDPNKVKADMLSSKEVGPTTGNINIPAIGLNVEGVKLPYDRQYQKLAENVIQIYGVDSARILTRGAVEPMQLAKRGVDRLSRIALGGTFGNNTALGGFLRNSLNSFTNPQFPSDEVNDLPGLGASTKNGLYGSLFHGGVNNNKNAIGNLLTSFATPNQIKQNIGSIESGKVKIGGAAIDMALNVGFSALQSVGKRFGLNAKRGGGNSALSKITNPLNNKNNKPPTFPSDYADDHTNNLDLTGIITGQSQLMREGERFYTKYEGVNAEKELKTLKINNQSFDSFRNSSDTIEKTLDTNIKIEKRSTQYTDYLEYQEDGETVYKFPNTYGTTIPKSFSSQIYKNGKVNTDGIQYDLIVDDSAIGDGAKLKSFQSLDEATALALKKSKQVELETVTRDGKAKKQKIKTHALLSKDALTNIESDLIDIKIDNIFLMSNLTGLTDTPTPNWGEAKAVGSPYKFYFYESYEREISFKAQMYATTPKELQFMWSKLNKIQLLNIATPGGILGIQGKIIPLKIGNMINEKHGFLTSCNVSVIDNSPWEIMKGSQAPFICEIDITYKVIHSDNNSYDTNLIAADISTNSSVARPPAALEIGPPVGSLDLQPVLIGGQLNPAYLPSPQLGSGDTIGLLKYEEDVKNANIGPLATQNTTSKFFNGNITQNAAGNIMNVNLFPEAGTTTNIPKSSTNMLGGAPE